MLKNLYTQWKPDLLIIPVFVKLFSNVTEDVIQNNIMYFLALHGNNGEFMLAAT